MAAISDLRRKSFAVMGNTAHITVIGGHEDHLDFAEQRLVELENLWSRFLRDSEVSLLNNSNCAQVPVHADTVKLVKYMIAGRQITDGLFDPTLLPALVANGYQRSLTQPMHVTLLPDGAKFNLSLDLVEIDEANYTISLPKGLTLDPGGIGKGLAADIVATELMSQSVSGVCVNVGGDIRCIGHGDIEADWLISIEAPWDANQILGTVRLQDGAVATSNVRAKTWLHDGVPNHHVLNPKTGLSRQIDQDSVVQVSVVARECAWAEVFATALLVADADMNFSMIDDNGLAALVVRANNETVRSSSWARFCNE